MHKLFEKQLARARLRSGEIEIDVLAQLVSAAYEEDDRDRRRTDRTIALMIEELDSLNKGLEQLVGERTRELRAREAELHAQNVRFDSALGNMSQGLLMLDADARVVISNQRYLQIYKLAPESLQPGFGFRDVIELRREAGTFNGDPAAYTEEFLATMASGTTDRRVVEIPDGRTISILSQPMPGGGWVSTHEDITERRRSEQQIAHMARHDALTDLPNRVLLREQLELALGGLHRSGRLALLYLDLDQFKGVNDTLGHPIGDELLKVVAERLQRSIRDIDTVARVGGDEFAIIQAGITDPAEAGILARSLCEAISAPCDLMGHNVLVNASIGIAFAPNDGLDSSELMKNADLALYAAKETGRDTYCFFEPEMDARVKARRSIEIDLRKALAEGQFELFYQPLVNFKQNDISCCEALIRWRHPERGIILPADFISIAEEIGLIVPLGEWVIQQACQDAGSWPESVKVAVNLSPTQLLSANLITAVVNALAASGLPPERLELEITEAVLMENTDIILSRLHQLRSLGVRISMDDFGTGYSSLSYLLSFPFDKIKIDRAFIANLPGSADALAIVRAVAGLAEGLRMTTTAEGVETQAQQDYVQALGFTEMQGYLFSPPLSLSEVLNYLVPTGSRAAVA
jgi:diguanylate cyclase (GGDEF)-like protein